MINGHGYTEDMLPDIAHNETVFFYVTGDKLPEVSVTQISYRLFNVNYTAFKHNAGRFGFYIYVVIPLESKLIAVLDTYDKYVQLRHDLKQEYNNKNASEEAIISEVLWRLL